MYDLKDHNLSGFKQTYQVNFTTVGSTLPICVLDNLHLTFCCTQKTPTMVAALFHSIMTLIGT